MVHGQPVAELCTQPWRVARCFTTVAGDGTVRESSRSVLKLESDDDDRLVRFGLGRWPEGRTIAPRGWAIRSADEPSYAVEKDYRSLGRQVVFF